MNTEIHLLEWLQEWFYQKCDGEWEHGSGIRIESLDNPGWAVFINLVDTNLADKPFSDLKIESSDLDWIHCRVRNGHFEGFCGPLKLQSLIEVFERWVSS